MGLRMDNLHAPTVASGPSTNGTRSFNQERRSLFELMNERDRILGELTALSSVLTSHNVDMQTPLLTPDGYPRADIDVAQIRTTRSKIIHLKNDYKWLMEKIEKGLHEHHASLANQPPSPHGSNDTSMPGASRTAPLAPSVPVEPPFAKVNSVADSSPAESAGLQVGDKIVKFGYVNWTNHEKLARVAQVVQANEGREIQIRVLRADADAVNSPLDLRLTPRRDWGGRGTLGCHLLPV